MISSMTSAAEEGSLISTPTHSSRTFKADENNSNKTSPSSFDSCSLGSKLSLDAVPRSKSTDCLEKPGTKSLLTPTHQVANSAEAQRDSQKSPVPKLGVSVGVDVLAEMKARQEKRSSAFLPSSSASVTEDAQSNKPDEKSVSSISVSEAKEKFLVTKNSLPGLVSRRPPLVAPKPRPWSTVGSDRRSGRIFSFLASVGKGDD